MIKKTETTQAIETIEESVNQMQSEIKQKVMSKKLFSKKTVSITVVVLLIIIGALLFWNTYTKSEKYKQQKAEKEAISLVKKVSKLMLLPAEKPVIFSVSDPILLANQQAFFKGSEKGDSLLVYSKSGKAIIYSLKRDIIVNVGPVTFDNAKPKEATPKAQEIKPVQETKK